ncbi:MAG TPA: inositol monophosphatase family protein [Candidatus Polarisedimenticolaceae bacterium]|nr:inositol monophosphatase family protein [Candidatus Polarisedimenticolaceae bacterium]
MPPDDLDALLHTARAAVEAASHAALRHWRRTLRVERKADRSPVTAADREAEAAVLAVVRRRWPRDAVLAEESGATAGETGRRWVVDPLDGTRGFARGGTFWGPLVAVEREGTVLAGAMALPALGETYWAARGQGTFRDGHALWVTDQPAWAEAVLSLGELPHLLRDPWGPAVRTLVDTAGQARCYGDLAACALLLNGRADAWLESGVAPWDLAALQVLVEEAGGRCTDFAGKGGLTAGQALAAGPALHAHALAVLTGTETVSHPVEDGHPRR